MADVVHGAADEAHDHEHEHSPFLAHHFDTPVQQFDAGKLGMWLFLATEVLLFGGLFCAYAVYRHNHPEIFEAGHVFLDKKWGGINTVVLLVSSFTMATGVYCAQRGLRFWLNICLVLTLLGGFGFMSIKYVEYKAKWEHGLLWGTHYRPHLGDHADAHAAEGGEHAATPGAPAAEHDAAAGSAAPAAAAESHAPAAAPPAAPSASAPATAAGATVAPALMPIEPTTVKFAAPGPTGLAVVLSKEEHEELSQIKNVQIFFGIYFAMTGLHGVHVLAGMAVIAWLLMRSLRGDFSKEYFTPVDLGGLYWHLVDLIWIYLFPLLYLIH